MGPREYTDLLLAFAQDDSKGQRFSLRLHPGEDDFFNAASGGDPSQVFPVELSAADLCRQVGGETDWSARVIGAKDGLQIGSSLWGALPPSAKERIAGAQPDSATPLRIKIYGSTGDITDLPWEWLTQGAGVPFALRENVRLTRCIPVQFPAPPLTVKLPLRVLLILTSPKDEKLLNAAQEVGAVSKGLQGPDYDLSILEEPTLDALREEIMENPPHVLHYIGHAGIDNGQGNIILHDARDMTYWLSSSLLSRMLPTTVRLICLSSCFTAPNYRLLGLSRLAHAPASMRLPTMIANQCHVTGEGVESFWSSFYPLLIEHDGNVNEAFHSARLSCHEQTGGSDWASFGLVIRDRTGKPLRLASPGRGASPKRKEDEYNAQFAAHFLNTIAEQVTILGASASKEILDLLETEKDRAQGFLNDIAEDE
ncbi:MAG: CHAT domain-containing protein [Blastocatellia bacterium]